MKWKAVHKLTETHGGQEHDDDGNGQRRKQGSVQRDREKAEKFRVGMDQRSDLHSKVWRQSEIGWNAQSRRNEHSERARRSADIQETNQIENPIEARDVVFVLLLFFVFVLLILCPDYPDDQILQITRVSCFQNSVCPDLSSFLAYF